MQTDTTGSTSNLKDAASEALGFDYEEAEVAKLRDMGFDAVAGDATNFDLDRKFDVVVAGEILEHVLSARGVS